MRRKFRSLSSGNIITENTTRTKPTNFSGPAAIPANKSGAGGALAAPPSPYPPSSAVVPFSWEHRPGIPKFTGNRTSRPAANHLLPLPPPIKSFSGTVAGNRKKRPEFVEEDPFAAALAECAKVSPRASNGDELEFLFRRPSSDSGGRRPVTWLISDRFGVIGNFYGSCKSSCSVEDSTVQVSRPVVRTGIYGPLGHRAF